MSNNGGKDKDEKLTTVCPACGKNHKPGGGKLTEKEQAAHHKD